MAKIAERVSDKSLLKLIRAFLRAGVMEGGLVSPVDEGTPQGGPLFRDGAHAMKSTHAKKPVLVVKSAVKAGYIWGPR